MKNILYCIVIFASLLFSCSPKVVHVALNYNRVHHGAVCLTPIYFKGELKKGETQMAKVLKGEYVPITDSNFPKWLEEYNEKNKTDFVVGSRRGYQDVYLVSPQNLEAFRIEQEQIDKERAVQQAIRKEKNMKDQDENDRAFMRIFGTMLENGSQNKSKTCNLCGGRGFVYNGNVKEACPNH